MGSVGVLDVNVWDDPSRTLTTTQFPFWSAIITQQRASISVPASSTVYVNIQPASGETWLIDLSVYMHGCDRQIIYYDYDGTTARSHMDQYLYSSSHDITRPFVWLQRVLTDTLYARLRFKEWQGYSTTGIYAYSGFKLSRTFYKITRLNVRKPVPLKRPISSRVVAFPKIEDLAYVDPDDRICYHVLTETIATAGENDFPVETREVHFAEEDVLPKLSKLLADPEKTGWKEILDAVGDFT